MRFMMMMFPQGYATVKPGTTPDPKAMAAMFKYNESLRKAGVLIGLEGLHAPSTAGRVSFKGGKSIITDGPFAETKEVLGGYWIIDVTSKAEALEWASRCPVSDSAMIEVRQLHEFSEFPAEIKQAAGQFPELRAYVEGSRHPHAKAP